MGEEQFRVEARVEGRVEGKSRFLPWLLVFIVAVAALLIPLLIFNGAPVLAGERAARANALDIAKSFFLLAASAGVGSMILVQTAKHLLRLRGWVNWMQVGRRFST